METIPTNVGAVIQRTLTSRPAGSQVIHYVRDDHGVWHYWNFSGGLLSIANDHNMWEKTEEPGEFEVVSEGYVPPVEEPKGLGAVVVVDSGFGVETKFVLADVEETFEAENWIVVGEPNRWLDWDYISSHPNLRVLSEGV